MFNNNTAIDVIDNMAGGSPSAATNAYIRADLMHSRAMPWTRLVTWWADATEAEQFALGSILGICEPSYRGKEFLPAALVQDALAVQSRVNALHVDHGDA